MDEIREKFIHKYKNGIPQILRKNLIADIETPISSLLKISEKQKYSFLLESVEGGSKRGRYSLLGCEPDLIWEVKENKAHLHYTNNNYNYKLSSSPLESLKELIEISKLPRENYEVPYPILVGYLGYPMIQYMENIKLNNPDNINIPEATLIRPKVVAVFDNIKDTISLMTLTYPSKNLSAIKAYDEAKNILDQTVKKLQKNSVDFYFNEISFENKLDFKSNYTKQEYFEYN